MLGISAWIVLSLPVGLLIGAAASRGRRAPVRPGPSAITLTAVANSCHAPAARPRRNRVEQLAQV